MTVVAIVERAAGAQPASTKGDGGLVAGPAEVVALVQHAGALAHDPVFGDCRAAIMEFLYQKQMTRPTAQAA